MPDTSLPDIKLVEKEVVRLDSRGLITRDIEFIKKHISPVEWKKGMTLEEMAYRQGQWDLLRFIEERVAGRRLE